jgi:chromosome segregation ATPase
MMIKQIFSKIGWNRNKSKSSVLLKDFSDSEESNPSSAVPLHASPMVTKKKDNIEVFNEAVEKLVGKLEHINENLSSQVQQNQQLVERMNTLPEMLMPLPKAVAEQRQAFAQVAEQLREKVARDEKVGEHLSGIHEKVTQAAAVDARMCDSFSAFSETLSKLDHDTVSQTEWLQQMNQTFSATERYLKYALAKQQARFYWVLGISLGISVLAIAGLIIGIFLLRG